MYKVEIKRHALKEIDRLPQQVKERALQEIELLKSNPRPFGSIKLQGFEDRWRIRIGDYRILYTLDDSIKHVVIYRVLHRKEVYR